MTTVALTAAYARTSLIHIPRRDLVLAASDSLRMRITVVESDSPYAAPIEVSGGLGGPGVRFSVWADTPGQYSWDYGCPVPACGRALWSSQGVAVSGTGAFDFSFPSGTMASWPRRCGWCVQLVYNTEDAEVLLTGRLHVKLGLGASYLFSSDELQTDEYVNVHSNAEEHVFT